MHDPHDITSGRDDASRIDGLLADRGRLERKIGRMADALASAHADVAARTAEVERLRAAIREHRDQKGDDRCWLDDERLYVALEDGGHASLALPPKCDFLASCERYWRQRQSPDEQGSATLPGGMTIAQLTAEVARLKEDARDSGWRGHDEARSAQP